ncbi:hypothetical protein [Bradyrhizobium sp. AZCC 1699]|uniref:hypothetical protein n=1 Tax=Bradyrhizobium sp. AZCC 1699 TaxID=3117024 RepID=UPI002FEF887D
MRRISLALLSSLFLFCLAGSVHAAELPYSEGKIWAITLIRVKPGMLNNYMREIVPLRLAFVEEAKKTGGLLESHIVVGDASSQDDWNMMVVDIYTNWAALDGLSAKFASLSEKLIGAEAVQVQVMNKRDPLRDIVGNKTMQELIPKK